MSQAKLRKWLYFALMSLRGQPIGAHYQRYVHEDRHGIPPDTTRRQLIRLLSHCQQNVPSYAGLMRTLGGSFQEDPEAYLERLPILTRDMLRSHFDELKSADLCRRRWYLEATSGSTGEAVRFIQDREFAGQGTALTLLYSSLAGREPGERQVLIWGSMRDIQEGTESWRTRLVNRLTGTTFLNAFRMDPERMRSFVIALNTIHPKLVIAYADSMLELARFTERDGLAVIPQAAIMTSAGTLFPFIRETVERVFQCKVFNRYGSREFGDIACERPGCEGLWVAPWGNYVEIVDGEGRRVPDGVEGEIVVTSLINHAMPLVRYRIGDRGVLAPTGERRLPWRGQVLKAVLGRTVDFIRTDTGALIHAGYFMYLLFRRPWVAKIQIVQTDLNRIVYRIVRTGSGDPLQAE